MEFLKSNLWELKKSTALQLFGGILALVHGLTYWHWFAGGKTPLLFHSGTQPMCWNLLESCDWVRVLSPAMMEVWFHAYGTIAVLAAATFFFTRVMGLAWFLLLLLTILKGGLYVQDLRLNSNFHYAIFLFNLAYLFIPNKARVLRWLVVSYYVAAGLLELSPNWLTGQWFVDQLQVPVKLAEWLAAMCVLTQLLAPVALWFRELRNFLIAYLVLIAYHGLLWYAGGFFEPASLILVLQLFPLLFYEERKIEREYLYQSFIRPEPSRLWLWLTLGGFWLIQALPFLPHETTPTIKALEQRLAMAPVAQNLECEQTTFLVFNGRIEEVLYSPPAERPARFRCNSQLRFTDLRNLCRERATESGFKTIMSYFSIRKIGEPSFHGVFQGDDICQPQLTYRDLVGRQGGI